MGMGHVNTTETYNREVLGNKEPLLMLRFPVASSARTFSYNSGITDSAAAGTALATGFKTVNSRVGMLPDSTICESIAVDFTKAGYPVAIATTVAGDDATPAAFYSHALARDEKDKIALHAIGSGIDFLGGGSFKISQSDVGKDWLDRMRKDGYTLCSDAAEAIRSRKGDKVLLVPAIHQGEQAGYTIDSIPGAMSLRDIVKAALHTLQVQDKDKFFMMMEGGNIDWAAHANDGAAVIKEVLAFQQAIQEAYDFYLSHPDETLIVVTADHDTGGMALGREDNRKRYDLALTDRQLVSKDKFNEWLQQRLEGPDACSWEEIKEDLKDKFGLWDALHPDPEQTDRLRAAFERTLSRNGENQTETTYSTFREFTAGLYDVLNQMYGIGWTSTYHTGNPVPVFAIGKGSEMFTGQLDNTQIPKTILKAAGLGR